MAYKVYICIVLFTHSDRQTICEVSVLQMQNSPQIIDYCAFVADMTCLGLRCNEGGPSRGFPKEQQKTRHSRSFCKNLQNQINRSLLSSSIDRIGTNVFKSPR